MSCGGGDDDDGKCHTGLVCSIVTSQFTVKEVDMQQITFENL